MRHVHEGCVCEICDHYMENSTRCYCLVENDNFGEASYPEECDDFEYGDYEDDADEDEEFDHTDVEECPQCGNDAYWDGSEYECPQCGWCGKA